MKLAQLLLTGLLCMAICSMQAEATIYFNDGESHTISSAVNDSITISNGSTVFLEEGGSVSGQIRIEPTGGPFTMTGGSIGTWLIALSSNPVTILGGIIGERIALDSSSGSGPAAGDVYIYGGGFKIDGIAVPYGTYHQSGHLTGTLLNGDLINVDFNCSGANDMILTILPEPATLFLLAFGGLAMLRKRK